MGFKKMSVDEWIKVRDNPRQRDTVRHADKSKHLKLSHPTHDTVFAASLPGGELVKLDGHTRAFLWSCDKLERPTHVDVKIYPVANMDEAKEYYGHFDSSVSVETSADKTSGGLSEAGIEPESGLIKYKANVSAYKKLDTDSKSIYQKICGWKREIALLDRVGFSKNSLQSGGVLGALVLLRCYQEGTSIKFLQLIQLDAGTKNDQGMDAVQMFRKIHDAKRVGHAEANIYEMAGRLIALYKGFVRGQRYSACPPAVDIKELLADARCE